MTAVVQSLVTNEKLTRITHWLVFGLGACCLSVSLVATALKVLGA